MFGRVVQGVRLSHVPDDIMNDDCPECYKLLWVKVIKADIVPGVKVSYILKSKYQFYIEFEFHGTFSIPVYEFTVQINPEFGSYFSEADMSQVVTIQVNPALLSRVDDHATLSLDASSVSVPEKAKQIL